MISSMRIAVMFLAVLLMSQGSAAAQRDWKTLVVPPAVDTRQEIKLMPKGWVALTDDVPHRVSGITVFDGRPQRGASLVPNGEEKPESAGRRILLWRLTPSTQEGIWITVSYHATSITLARRLPEGISGLRVTYDTTVATGGLNEIVCIEYH